MSVNRIAVLAILVGCSCGPAAVERDGGATDWTPTPPEVVRRETTTCEPITSTGLTAASPRPSAGIAELLWAYEIGSDPRDLEEWRFAGISVPRPATLVLAETSAASVVAHPSTAGEIVIDAAGQWAQSFTSPPRTRAVPPVAAGDLLVDRGIENVWVHRVGENPAWAYRWEPPPDAPPVEAWETASPAAVSAGGELYVALGPDRVLSFCASDGAFRWELRYDAPPQYGATDIFVDEDSDLWLTTGGPEIVRLSRDGQVLARMGAGIDVGDALDHAVREGMGAMPGCGFYTRASQFDEGARWVFEVWSRDGERASSWEPAYVGPDGGRIVSVAATPDCGLLVATSPPSAAVPVRLRKLGAEGDVEWSRELPGFLESAFALDDRGFLLVGPENDAEGRSVGIRLTRVDAAGEESATALVGWDRLGAPSLTSGSLSLGRDGVLYGATLSSYFAIATGLRPAPDIRTSGTGFDARSNPGRTGSAEAAWFRVP